MAQFNYEIVKDPRIFAVNRMDPHSDHVCYASLEEQDSKNSSFRCSLDGLWKFSYAKNYQSTILGFETSDYDCSSWADIRVPAHIQMEGYDSPQYANTQYPWDGREDIEAGEIPSFFNPVASYVKYFTVPEQMKGKPLFISFQGVESGMALWLNGVYVGYSEDSFTPSEFELTPYLVEGENKLAVQVFKWTASSWCEDQDFFRFSGIYRSVYLYTVPKVHVQDVKIRTLLDDQYQNADLEITLKGSGKGKVSMTLQDSEGVVAQAQQEMEAEFQVARDELLDMLRAYMEQEDRAILVSSHISSDLEGLCDDIYMINDGKIILYEETDVLLDNYGILKLTDEQYEKLDKKHILRHKKEEFGYSCLTDERQFYQENYPDAAVEKGTIDELILMMIRGKA